MSMNMEKHMRTIYSPANDGYFIISGTLNQPYCDWKMMQIGSKYFWDSEEDMSIDLDLAGLIIQPNTNNIIRRS